jgi:23S rRNA (pseudouridine1915-N3)-methyltransferase
MNGIRILCVGKIKESYIADGIKEALSTIRRRYPVEIRECPDEPTPEGASAAQAGQILKKEGQRILQAIKKEDYVIALCIEGKHYDSPQWKKHLDQVIRCLRRSDGSLVFVIGGSLGLSKEVISRANEHLSFSAMTFPHQLMRLVLLEELAALFILI